MTEIERRFLVKNDSWRGEVSTTRVLQQGYLSTEENAVVRVRLEDANAWLTVKGKKEGGSALEFEYPIPREDAQTMLARCAQKPFIEKFRHLIERDGIIWEVDEFLGENLGLIIAEVELVTVEQNIVLPQWIGIEITSDGRYANASLVAHPFSSWGADTTSTSSS